MFQPYGNSTSCPPAAWHPEPNFRGTYNVLSTCLFTMSLCIWTAVHCNIPEHKKEHYQWIRKVGWLVMGLLAPEIVAWNAWEQRRQVKRLTRKMQEIRDRRSHTPARPEAFVNKIRCRWRKVKHLSLLKDAWHNMKVFLLLESGDPRDGDNEDRRVLDDDVDAVATWTELHSWYAVMGGFAFDASSAEKPFLPPDRERMTLTVEDIILLAKKWPHLIPKLTKGDIMDKSKFDGLTKIITCWQAAWFCVQCIVRVAQHLSISLLELNVFGHAICAFVIYAIWWGKPKDIQEPTKLTGNRSHSVAALFYTISPLGLYRGRTIDQRLRLALKGWRLALHWLLGAGRGDWCNLFIWVPSEPKADYLWLPQGLSVAMYEASELMNAHCVRIGDAYWSLQDYDIWTAPDPVSEANRIVSRPMAYDEPLPYDDPISIDRYTVERLQRIEQDDKLLVQSFWGPEDRRTSRGRPRALVRARILDWCLNERNWKNISKGDAYRNYVGMSIATTLYGGLHATAWAAQFPNNPQRLLWRLSSIIVALAAPILATWLLFSALLSALLAFFGFIVKLAISAATRRWFVESWKSLETWGYGIAWYAIVFLLILLAMPVVTIWCSPVVVVVCTYPVCRVFLVVESFINLARLSEDVLALPTWSQYVPHVV